MPTRPVWAEISLDRLIQNFKLLSRTACRAAPSSTLLAVVKADAYGHGVEICGPALAAAGAGWLGVTSVDEGSRLRRALGVLPSRLSAARILIMSSFWLGEADTLLDRALTPLLWEPYQCAVLTDAARTRGLGPATVPVHLEIDTGMARQGIAPGPPLASLLAEHLLPGSPLTVEGVMTHFSAPELLDGCDTDRQLACFESALRQLAAAGVRPRYIHAGNSASIFDEHQVAALQALADRFSSPDHQVQLMLRPGLALYGYAVRFTPPSAAPDQSALQPVLAWKTRITSLRELTPGQGPGYNSTFQAARYTRLALTPVGYADGLNRLLSNNASMLVRGQHAPIAGRISMDQTILDVTDIPRATIGDEIVILGQQANGSGSATISAWEHADLCGTIPYEVLCNIAARVPREVAD